MNIICCPMCKSTDVIIVRTMLENNLVEAKLKCKQCEHTWERSVVWKEPSNE